MSRKVIEVSSLTKTYYLRQKQQERYVALRDVLSNKIKGILNGNKTSGFKTETFNALDDVSFDIHEGDRVGIVGRNGAGKSTLLKVLSRIVAPTKGRITIDGRVASLLEVGTGFHPELSGRENIFLNGSILGMTRKEIQSKFDEIVAFSEVEKFLDTPVKRYSSGMYVRLAFSVAAHLEPEILIVDEVLAVGDAAFQRKCLGKMKDVSGEGRTILFVSHNMEAVQKLCNKGIMLQNGRLIEQGTIEPVIKKYLEAYQNSESRFTIPSPENAEKRIAVAYELIIENSQSHEVSEVSIGEYWQIRIRFRVQEQVERFVIALGLSSSLDMPIQTTWSKPSNLNKGEYEAIFSNTQLWYAEGHYRLVVGLSSNGDVIQYNEGVGTLSISDVSLLPDDTTIINTKSGLIMNQLTTQIIKVN
jgi:lipopolysaccharide transport system ATP-binding protein